MDLLSQEESKAKLEIIWGYGGAPITRLQKLETKPFGGCQNLYGSKPGLPPLPIPLAY